MSKRQTSASREIVEGPVRRKRGGFDIMSDIIANIPKEGIRKTALANRSMLDYRVFERYFELMLREGLVTYDRETGVIHATERGLRFHEEWKSLKSMIAERRLRLEE